MELVVHGVLLVVEGLALVQVDIPERLRKTVASASRPIAWILVSRSHVFLRNLFVLNLILLVKISLFLDKSLHFFYIDFGLVRLVANIKLAVFAVFGHLAR